MNFLAHLYIADTNNDSLIGHLLGDFVKGRAFLSFEPDIRDAILFHRRIDTFSDTHAVTRVSRNRISQQRRRFAGVIIDVCYDHFLTRHWNRYTSEPLAGFCQRVYAQLERDPKREMADIQPVLNSMIAYDWLGGYRHLQNLSIVLDRIAGRLSRGERFMGGIVEIESNYRQLEADFLSFFPDLLDYSRNYSGLDEANASETSTDRCTPQT